MQYFVTWYIVLSLFALAALPLTWTWFRYLPDRGWGLLRPLGLLIVGVTVWYLGTFGLLRLDAGSGLGGLVVLFSVGIWTLHRWGGGLHGLHVWLREHRKLLLVEETIFFVAFAFWVWYRIHDTAGIAHTEQPMNFAFMNAILRGGEFPPNDPWLSGFAISYYYLGYVIVAQVAALSGTPSGVAYNLGLMTLAAMASVGSFSIAYNLIITELNSRRVAVSVALLAPLLLLGISNLTGLLTMTYHRNIGPASLYNWFNVVDLTVDPVTLARSPQSGWWWWAASRTLAYLNSDGVKIDVIDEFPFFSFMLGDMHPHVLALPFTILSLAVALNALVGALKYSSVRQWGTLNLPPETWQVGTDFGKLVLLLITVIVGAFTLLNTWDLPTVATIIMAVWFITALIGQEHVKPRSKFVGWLSTCAFLVSGVLLLYLFFFVSFRSQADGIRISLVATPPPQYFLMFGLFWLVLIPLVLSQIKRVAEVLQIVNTRTIAITGLMLLVDAGTLLLLLKQNYAEQWVALLMAMAWFLIPLILFSLMNSEEPILFAIVQVAGFPLLTGLIMRRWTTVFVAVLLGLTLFALWARIRLLISDVEATTNPISTDSAIVSGSQMAHAKDVALNSIYRAPQASLIFALGLAAMAQLLTMGPEIFYIKDGFGGRMNTVFKLYYQAWSLMSIASVFGIVYLVKRMPRALSVPWLTLFALLTAASMWYPVEALQSKANFNGPAHWDGRFWMQNNDPDRFAAIEWLNALPNQVVILEKVGGAYNPMESALAGWTGHSTLLGWKNHEGQWRGDYEEINRREPVVRQIYQSTDPAATRMLIEQWDIDYVAITPSEVAEYELTSRQINKFRDFMTPVFSQGGVVLFGR